MPYKRKNGFLNMIASDRKVLGVLVCMFASAVLTTAILRSNDTDNDASSKTERKSKDTEKGANQSYAQKDVGYGDGSRAADEVMHPFPFDPNTADSTTLLRLGLKPWQVRSIYKYRAHGGRYYKPEDFARLYGLTLSQYNQLKPFIKIAPVVMAADVVRAETYARKDYNKKGGGEEKDYNSSAKDAQQVRDVVDGGKQFNRNNKLTLSDPKVDINTADTVLLKRIPGIGSYFSRRIVELRQRRQAFSSVEELLSIRNFPETALVYMTVSNNFPSVNINSFSQKELSAHPLINYTQARDIVALRRSMGKIRSVADLKFLKSFTQQQLERLAPHLVFLIIGVR